jgi:hypothetical protein
MEKISSISFENPLYFCLPVDHWHFSSYLIVNLFLNVQPFPYSSLFICQIPLASFSLVCPQSCCFSNIVCKEPLKDPGEKIGGLVDVFEPAGNPKNSQKEEQGVGMIDKTDKQGMEDSGNK